jgi:hypothetical protein
MHMTIRIAAIEVSHWHAVFDTVPARLGKPLALTRFFRSAQLSLFFSGFFVALNGIPRKYAARRNIWRR